MMSPTLNGLPNKLNERCSMRRVEDGGSWSLFCPQDVPELPDKVGVEFDEAYQRREQSSIARTTMPARELWSTILQTQVETGGPFMLYKDSCNCERVSTVVSNFIILLNPSV